MQISDWRNPRRVQLDGSTVKAEITLSRCQNCPSCSDRIHTIQYMAEQNGVKYEWEEINGVQCFVTELPEALSVPYSLLIGIEPSRKKREIAHYLSTIFGLRVT